MESYFRKDDGDYLIFTLLLWSSTKQLARDVFRHVFDIRQWRCYFVVSEQEL